MKTKDRFLIALLALLVGIMFFLILTGDDMKLKRDTQLFNEGKLFVCDNTLIVTNRNWHLSGDHLINNNSAGYINFRKCVIE